eukprot:CAMPEP_0119123408 /NCGR_PEP_ID=MMETSP1310-20130426/3355_1 /TAXON_ID=464262 /ORGANISM="Genus nov. species nov., Strain RCC2339" /LENGTH=615 /DNA_ID=CAMNT_0007113209 /DNA_START=40 /DNA_END=1884 /DNA_ORIENTATION=-
MTAAEHEKALAAMEKETPWEERVKGMTHCLEKVLEHADSSPNAPAITYVQTGDLEEKPVILSYAVLRAQMHRVANAIYKLEGVSQGDVVAVSIPSVPQAFFAIFGASLGGPVLPLNFLLSPDHLCSLVNAANVKVLVALGPHPMLPMIWAGAEAVMRECPNVRHVVQVRVIPGAEPISGTQNGKSLWDFENLIGGASTILDPAVVDTSKWSLDNASFLFHTGGTTGRPKIALHSHNGSYWGAWAVKYTGQIEHSDTILQTLPLFHVGGLLVIALSTLLAGGNQLVLTSVGVRSPKALQNWWHLVDKYNCTIIGAVPTAISMMLKVPRPKDLELKARLSLTGASAISPATEEEWENVTGLNLKQLYGMTELSGGVCLSPIKVRCPLGSCGLRSPYAEVKVTDTTTGEPVAPGVVGEIIARSPGSFKGYFDKSLNNGVLLNDGWIGTGDLGKIDSDGFVFITGRAKDVIIRSGHNIDPSVVTEALVSHPSVLHAAAIGRPDVKAGELPVAYVELRPGSDSVKVVEELHGFCKKNIGDRAALPKRITAIDTMPLTAVGKMFLPALREMETKHALATAFKEAKELEGVEPTIIVTTVKKNRVAHVTVSDKSKWASVEAI